MHTLLFSYYCKEPYIYKKQVLITLSKYFIISRDTNLG